MLREARSANQYERQTSPSFDQAPWEREKPTGAPPRADSNTSSSSASRRSWTGTLSRSSASSATWSRSAPISSRTATTFSARALYTRDPATTTGPSRRCASTSTATAGTANFASTESGVDVHRRRHGPTRSGRGAGLKKKIEAGQDVSSELLEGARLARAAAGGARFGRGARVAAADGENSRRSARHLDGATRIQRALDDDFHALMEEHLAPDRPHAISIASSSITVDRERARFAAWYEMFPRSQIAPIPTSAPRHGTLRRRRARVCRALAELGFDVVYLPPIHPIGRTFRKGQEQLAHAGARTTSAVRGRSATRTADTRPSSPRSAPSRISIGSSRSARELGHGDRARLRAAMLARSSVGARASRLVLHPSRRHDQVRRESAEEVSGHLSAELLVRRSRGTLERVPRRRAVLDRARREDLSRRQPAHQAARVLGMDDSRHPARSSRRDLLRRGVHASEANEEPGQAWLHDVVHVLHVEEQRVRSCASTLEELTQSPMVEYFRGNLFANTPDILQ